MPLRRRPAFRPLELADLELSEPTADLAGLDGYGAVRVLVRLHGVPVGSFDLPLRGPRCAGAELRAAALQRLELPILRQTVRHLLQAPLEPELDLGERLARRRAGTPAARPSVSVAVCTRDRPDDLALCLDALARVREAPDEILVVDNAPASDATQRLVGSSYPTVRYVVEPRPGLNWARNRAVLEARGEVLAYTDDDVLVDPGWVGALAELFGETPEVMAAAGLVVPAELETEAQLAFEEHGGFSRGFRRTWLHLDRRRRIAARYGPTGRIGTGANMAFRRELFERIGGWDPALDVGTLTRGGGDLEMFFRVLKEGHLLVQEPSALVRHRHRRDYAELRSQLSTWGVGMYAYVWRTALAYPEEVIGFLWIAVRWLGLRNARRLLRAMLGTSLRAELVWDEMRGSILAPWRYTRARREAERIMAEHGPTGLEYRASRERRSARRGSGRATARVDLSEPLPVLEVPRSAARLRVEVSHARRPLGSLQLSVAGDPVRQAQLADAIADRLAVPIFQAITGGPRRTAGEALRTLFTPAAGADPRSYAEVAFEPQRVES